MLLTGFAPKICLTTRQSTMVTLLLLALKKFPDTLGVAPTGAGKTVIMGSIIGEILASNSSYRCCFLAHRDKLVEQNKAEFERLCPDISTLLVWKSEKDWQGRVIFATVQTLSRIKNLESMPSLDLLVIDEAHHVCAPTYQIIIDRARTLNPNVKLLGLTATAARGDKKGLGRVFSNVGDIITVSELIASGRLVRPRSYIVDLGLGIEKELDAVEAINGEYNMAKVERIMNTLPMNEAVVTTWKKMAGNRRTVIFCSTIQHAKDVSQSFIQAGVSAVAYHSKMSDSENDEALAQYTSGRAQIIVNVAVLTEGWDDQPTSCVVLLRPSSHKSTMIQMVGRGLRVLDKARYPDVVKDDCIVLDFGTSTRKHGSIDTTVCLDDGKKFTVCCLGCGQPILSAATECPLCGYVFEIPQERKYDLGDVRMLRENEFKMEEFEILSKFLWVDVEDSQGCRAYMAKGFDAWAGTFHRNGRWFALGALTNTSYSPRVFATGDQGVCFAVAAQFLADSETSNSASRSSRWQAKPASDKQMKMLMSLARDTATAGQTRRLTSGQAAVYIQLNKYRKHIERVISEAQSRLEQQ